MALTCVLLFPLLISWDLTHHFFSGHYIPSGLISLISHWLSCQTNFFILALRLRMAVAVSSVICPLICLGFIFFKNYLFLTIFFFVYPSGRKRGWLISMKLWAGQWHHYKQREEFHASVGPKAKSYKWGESVFPCASILTPELSSLCTDDTVAHLGPMFSGLWCHQGKPQLFGIASALCCLGLLYFIPFGLAPFLPSWQNIYNP